MCMKNFKNHTNSISNEVLRHSNEYKNKLTENPNSLARDLLDQNHTRAIKNNPIDQI